MDKLFVYGSLMPNNKNFFISQNGVFFYPQYQDS